MPSLDDILVAAQEEIANERVKAAKYDTDRSLFESSAAALYREKAQLALKEQEIMLQRARNWNRPSMVLGVELEQTNTGWAAFARGVRAEGNSPEQACLEFDRLWTQGEE